MKLYPNTQDTNRRGVASKVGNTLNRIETVLAVMAGILLVFAMLTVSYEVIVRATLGITSPPLFEIWEYILLYIPFLGAAWLLRKGGHVGVDIVLDHLKIRTRTILNIVTSILGAMLSLGLTYFGVEATWQAFHAGYRIPGILFPPQGLILIIVPIGSLLLLAEFLRRTAHLVQGLHD